MIESIIIEIAMKKGEINYDKRVLHRKIRDDGHAECA